MAPAIVDHSWLAVNPQTYDNYPSDNNPVRILPKLADLWNPDGQSSTGLVPNVQPQAPCRMATKVSSDAIVREAKKAMMLGAFGKELASHLRDRFAAEDIAAAKDELGKLASEQGLLGNVYIDASAFTSLKEAEDFLSKHRARLAQDIVVGTSTLNADAMKVLANRFRKNVVASVTYDAALLRKYRDHLLVAGKIAHSTVVDSKETLRAAFLDPVKEPVVSDDSKKVTPSGVPQEETLEKMAKINDQQARLASDEVDFAAVRSIVAFAREHLAKGKTGSALKEILRGKYAQVDLQKAAKFLAVISTDDRVASIDRMVSESKVTRRVANELKAIAQKYPMKAASEFIATEAPRQVGTPGHVLSTFGPKITSEDQEKAIESLMKGASVDDVFKTLRQTMSQDKAASVLTAAVAQFNNGSVGKKANVFVPAPKKKVVADVEERDALPDPSTIQSSIDNYTDMFAGSNEMVVDIDAAPKKASVEIGDLFNRSGIDSVL